MAGSAMTGCTELPQATLKVRSRRFLLQNCFVGRSDSDYGARLLNIPIPVIPKMLRARGKKSFRRSLRVSGAEELLAFFDVAPAVLAHDQALGLACSQGCLLAVAAHHSGAAGAGFHVVSVLSASSTLGSHFRKTFLCNRLKETGAVSNWERKCLLKQLAGLRRRECWRLRPLPSSLR